MSSSEGRGGQRMWQVKVLVALLVVAGGVRAFLAEWRLEPQPPVRPLAEFPYDAIEGWECEDIEATDRLIEIAGVDDWLYRRYTDGHRTFILWVGYVEGGTAIGLHYPERCFPNQGYSLEQREVVSLPGEVYGGSDPARFYETVWTSDTTRPVYSLNSFRFQSLYAPETEAVRRADRGRGLPYWANLILSGDLIGTAEGSRAEYVAFLERVLPLLEEHFPE